jgi:hypothetical protein
MPVNLRCECGYEVQLTDDEAQETTWCPRCRKVLVRPKDVTAQRAFTRGGRAPAAGGSGGGVGARIAGGILIALILAVSRGACTDSSRYDPPNVDLPEFHMAPVQQIEMPQIPEIPQQDDPARPGFMPLPENRNPFFPPDRNPLLPRDKDDDLPGGDQPGPRPDDP